MESSRQRTALALAAALTALAAVLGGCGGGGSHGGGNGGFVQSSTAPGVFESSKFDSGATFQ